MPDIALAPDNARRIDESETPTFVSGKKKMTPRDPKRETSLAGP